MTVPLKHFLLGVQTIITKSDPDPEKSEWNAVGQDGNIFLGSECTIMSPYSRRTVLEPTGIPVTGTPSIPLECNFIINRSSIYVAYKWRSICQRVIVNFLNRWRTCNRYTCDSRTEESVVSQNGGM